VTRGEIEEIAEQAAQKAVIKTFLTLGVDIGDPKAVIKLQDDLRFLDRWRGSTEAASAHFAKTVIGIILTGALGWLGLILWRHQ
jgi:hypothetical protein